MHLFESVQVLELSGLDGLLFLSLCRFWSLGCLKPAQAQKNAPGKKHKKTFCVSEEWKTDFGAFSQKHRAATLSRSLYERLEPTAANSAFRAVSREISLASDIIATTKTEIL